MDQVLVVTGGSRGIGAETARLAASRGYAVAVNYRERADAAELLVNEIRTAGGSAIAIQADVAESADVERLFDTVDYELGRVTAFVNSAGHGGGYVRAKDFDSQVLDAVGWPMLAMAAMLRKTRSVPCSTTPLPPELGDAES